jgi:hypothetical protein
MTGLPIARGVRYSASHMALWREIAQALGPDDSDLAAAEALYAQFKAGDLLDRTQTSLLRHSDAAMALLYSMLERDQAPRRPARDEADSAWMLRSDFCYLNARACAIDSRAGSFLQAAKILPAIASDAIHLAPFHPNHYELLYVPEGQALIDPSLADDFLLAAGISLESQLRAFAAACHLLGKAVGFDLMPYAAQFGRVVLDRPELFRWLRLDEERNDLAIAADARRYSAQRRMEYAERVQAIVSAVRDDYGIDSLKRKEGDGAADVAAKDKAYYTAIQQCIDRGLWPVLMNPWNGIGLPAYIGYNAGGEFPLFAYRDQDGADAGAEASGVVSPYAFYDGLPSSLSYGLTSGDDTQGSAITRNEEAIRYYSHIFDQWRDSFGFDFVRYDSVDRVLDLCADDAGCVPLSDRPTPDLLREAVGQSRKGLPGVGALAERNAPDFEEFGAMGFDLVMGNDMLRRIDAPLIRDTIDLYERLAESAGCGKATVCFAIDAHDTGDPRRWGSPLARLMGPERMHLRHGLARFISLGPVRRPMYETMGFQDLSSGIYEAETSIKGLSWADDAPFARSYAAIERLYKRLRPFLDNGVLGSHFIAPAYAWWIVHGKSPGRQLVVACSLETAEGRDPGRLDIELGKHATGFEGVSYALPACEPIPVATGGKLSLELRYLEMLVVDLSPSFY